jgi:hypothetical protein
MTVRCLLVSCIHSCDVLSEDTISVGARGDSAHEYLLKQYLLTSKRDKKSLELCMYMHTDYLSSFDRQASQTSKLPQ